MEVKIRPARPEDAYAVASLIIDAMSEECCLHFMGTGHSIMEFRQFMTALVMREDSQYSWKNTLVADADGCVAGIAVSYDGGRLHDLRKVFLDGMARVFGKDWSHMDDETAAGELYLDSFAVLPTFRKQGIGRQLLAAVRKKASKMRIPAVGLLVDEANREAQEVYRKLGFFKVGTNQWGGHRMYHLQLPARSNQLTLPRKR